MEQFFGIFILLTPLVMVAAAAFWWWRRQKTVGDEDIRVEFLTSDWSLFPIKLKQDKMLQLATSDRLRQSWFLDPEAIYENEKGERVMLCVPDSAIPIYPSETDAYRLKKAEGFQAISTQIAERACIRQENDNRREEKTDRLTETVQVLLLAGGAVIVFLILIWLVTSGQTISCSSPI